MTKRRGYALLSAIIALIVALSAAIYVGVAADDGTGEDALAAPGTPHNSAAPASTGVWVGTWAAAPVGAEPGTEVKGLAGRTVRNVVHTSVGGTSARITLSNLYGTQPLTIAHATIAVAAADNTAAAAAETLRGLTFDRDPSVVIPAGGQVISDAVAVLIPRDSDVLVSTYSPTPSGPVTYHPHARQISYLAQGDRTQDTTGSAYTADRRDYWRYLTALDVLSNEADGTIVAFGDSITDGVTSTLGANRRWPDVLARRVRSVVEEGAGAPRYSVVNEGISGNQILADGRGRPADNLSGLKRFNRDALGRTNVKVVIVDLGVNDILRNADLPDPNRMVAGLRLMVRQAHARGVKVVGATVMPFQGHPGFTPAREGVRREVNAAIRAGDVFDAVADFDRALRDPYDPRRLRPEYDSGDHLHPSDAGYARMAEVISLSALKGSAPAEL